MLLLGHRGYEGKYCISVLLCCGTPTSGASYSKFLKLKCIKVFFFQDHLLSRLYPALKLKNFSHHYTRASEHYKCLAKEITQRRVSLIWKTANISATCPLQALVEEKVVRNFALMLYNVFFGNAIKSDLKAICLLMLLCLARLCGSHIIKYHICALFKL